MAVFLSEIQERTRLNTPADNTFIAGVRAWIESATDCGHCSIQIQLSSNRSYGHESNRLVVYNLDDKKEFDTQSFGRQSSAESISHISRLTFHDLSIAQTVLESQGFHTHLHFNNKKLGTQVVSLTINWK